MSSAMRVLEIFKVGLKPHLRFTSKVFVWFFCLLFGILSNPVQGQIVRPRCDYQPIDFGEVEPLWSKLIIDSTMIGHVFPEYVEGPLTIPADSIADGMEHLSRLDEFQSIVDGDALYSITIIFVGGDSRGYHIEKIDLENGESQWVSIVDHRNRDYAYKSFDAKVVEDRLVIRGGRRVDMKRGTTSGNIRGILPMYPMVQVFDTATGDLIEEYVADSMAVDQPLIFTTGTLRHEVLKERGWESYRLSIFKADGETVLVRNASDSLGNAVITQDTVYAGGDFLGQWAMDTSGYYLASVDPLEYRSSDSTYVFVQQRGRRFQNVGPPPAATITRFNHKWEVINRLDITDILPDDFSGVSIVAYEQGRIVLRCCAFFHPQLNCPAWFVVLDDDLNVINLIDTDREDGSSYLHGSTFDADHNLYFVDDIQVAEDRWVLGVFRSNDHGTVDLLFTANFADDRARGSAASSVFVLQDGDLLFRRFQTCRFDDRWSRSKSSFPEWFRIDASDLTLPVATEDVTRASVTGRAYPNPATDFVRVAFEEVVSGECTIYDLAGQAWLTKTVQDVDGAIFDIQDLPQGTYVLRLISDSGEVWTDRVAKL